MNTIKATIIAIVLGGTTIGCLSTSRAPTQKAVLSGSTKQNLVLALYPYVPRISQFQTTIQQKWNKVHPDIPLQVIADENQWDGGYSKNPAATMDVFVFDALYLNFFRAQNYLVPLGADKIDNIGDLLSYAINGVKIDGSYYGIPLLGCSNILFYRKGDQQLENARTLSDIYNALGQCTYTSEVPPDARGMMVDMAGGTTNASNYVVAEHWVTQQFPVNLPWTSNDVDQSAIEKLKRIMAMSSYYNTTSENPNAYARGAWFGQGLGRAYIDFTESLSAMSAPARSNIAFKPMPFSDKSTAPLFYSDVIGVNTTTQGRGTTALAIELANMLASTESMVASMKADSSGTPQYLIAARNSALQQLSQADPTYLGIYTMVNQANPILFALNERARDWVSAMKSTLIGMIRAAYPCGCDYQAGPIWNQQDAESKCPSTCTSHGGWNRQWRTTTPGTMSVCGCNTCP